MVKPKSDSAERLRQYREAKLQKSREKSARYYSRNKDTISTRRRAIREKAKQHRTEPMPSEHSLLPGQFSPNLHRQEKKWLIDKVKNILPSTPEKRAQIVMALAESPTVRREYEKNNSNIKTNKEAELGVVVLRDIREALEVTKHQRRNTSRKAMNTLMGMVSGKAVEEKKLKGRLAKTLKINQRRITKGIKHRKTVLYNKTACWTYTERRVRSDTIPEDHKRLAYKLWASPGNSRPTGNKKDTIKQRLGPKKYCVHFKQILEKTQTEIYNEFKRRYPAIKMGQRTFEKCKPFFVVPARAQDRVTCCCKQHVETRMIFKSCMDYRRTLVSGQDSNSEENFQVFSHLSDFVEKTLCPQNDGKKYHNKECLYRICKNCGVNDRHFKAKELDTSINADKITWHKFSYVGTGSFSEDGKEKRKLVVESVTTPVGELFLYFKRLLDTYPAHQFHAAWQNEQMQTLIEHLPINHVIAVHDYSENYSCTQQDQIQSMYFNPNQASIHVTIVHRHSTQTDGFQSTEDNPAIVTEHLFVISPDTKHDHHSVHECRCLLAKHLSDVGCHVKQLHEWTDGCSSQYKSRHCMGDVSFSQADFNFPTIRNYFETSHAKGPQDGAGANLKHMADMAVIKRTTIIQNAEDLFKFANSNIQEPAPLRYNKESRTLKRRVFFYVAEHNHRRLHRQFSEVEGNRNIHSIRSIASNKIEARHLSCYCENCLNGSYNKCINTDYVDRWRQVDIPCENSGHRFTRSEVLEQVNNIKDLVLPDSVVAIAAADRGEDYYLLKVSQSTTALHECLIDEYGQSYPVGAEVIRGNFFVKCKENFTFKLDTRLAAVYAATVRYICVQLEKVKRKDKELFKIDENSHLDILFSL